ncbi:MAG TPA: ATP-binding protein [Arthrobacter bacterium]|jgi:serine/threonine-protein kinase RsbW|nr:ATP-binding protein [Arthrobacter sp.]HAP88574.1 ATP-binding protein [Arthrobacter sp.]HBH58523.1 ATP-binding protein [Arthrobacter sp.]HCB57525.1 ATP-binding protein [Arthrobacter sp.]HCC40313.1 ATP-binding protein [Arthrobacter sp.]
MTDVLAQRSFRGLSAAEAIESVHNELDGLWEDAPFVQAMDQMTFTTAVIESASNIVQHAVPAKAQKPVELGVEISVQPSLLQARVSAFYAKPPFGPLKPGTPDDDSESGRGLALIEALVTTVTFERQNGTNTWILTRTSQS